MDSGETLVVPVSEFEGRVRLYWDKPSRTERQIAEYILKNEDTVSQVSVHTLEQDAGVGAASVIRFSKALGYQGFLKYHKGPPRQSVRDEHRLPDGMGAVRGGGLPVLPVQPVGRLISGNTSAIKCEKPAHAGTI